MSASMNERVLPARLLRAGTAVLIAGAASVFLLPGVRQHVGSSAFLPHAYCYLWNRPLIWLHVSSDGLIGLSYLAISATLGIMVWRGRQWVPFSWMFLAFGTFILACGAGHFLEILTLYRPLYWVTGYEKALTALVSVITATALPSLVPKAVALARAEVEVRERTSELERSNRDLESFSYSVSHDLRAPLRHIHGFTRILRDDYAATLPADAQRYLERIEHGAQEMGMLIDDLLKLGRIGRQELSRAAVPLESLVTEAIAELHAHREKDGAEFHIAPLPVIACDRGLMKMVLINLLSNALKFSRHRSPAVIEVGAQQRDGECAVFVRDNGVGFDMKYAEKLFGLFQRLHRAEDFEGTGVGLAIVASVVQRHRGRAWAESKPDAGATFFFTVQPVNGWKAPSAEGVL
jgi:signal transduction histidine kinase